MDQFCSDSCSNFSFPNQIHIDLCETEQEYILETDVPNVTEQNVVIKKMKTGLTICILHNNISLQRIIPLPDNIIYKKMLACLENGYLAIHISKMKLLISMKESSFFKLRVNIYTLSPSWLLGLMLFRMHFYIRISIISFFDKPFVTKSTGNATVENIASAENTVNPFWYP